MPPEVIEGVAAPHPVQRGEVGVAERVQLVGLIDIDVGLVVQVGKPPGRHRPNVLQR